jgi:hemerythrin-like domain-containing protein
MDKNSINNPILKQSQEHELLVEYLAIMDKMIEENNLSALTLILRRQIHFMKKYIIDHFAKEESVFFRAVIDGSDEESMTVLVEELKEEHKQLIELLDKVDNNIKANLQTTRETPRKVASVVVPFLNLFKQHIRKEVEILFPFISENKRCGAIITRLQF